MVDNERLAQELNQLRATAARGDVKAFYEQLLASISQATSAEAGLVWNCSRPPYGLICQHQLQQHPTLRSAVQQNEHLALLDNALRRKQPMLIPPRDDAPQEMPIIALGPVARNGNIEIIELFLRSDRDQQTYKRWLECLQYYCEVAASLNHSGSKAPAQAEASTSLTHITGDDLDQYVEEIHRDLTIKSTAARIANETRRLLKADRVTVVQRVRSHGRAIAISGQPSVNRRSNTVQLLEQLANRVLPLGSTFWYPEEETELSGEVEQPLNDYLTISTTRSLIAIPILEADPPATSDVGVQHRQRKWIGGLVIEQFDAKWEKSELQSPIDFVTRHASSALRNAVQHRSLLFYPIWHTLGKSRLAVAARNLKLTTAIGLAVLAVIAALVFIRVPFRVACDGVLIPKERQYVFASVAGIVDEVRVEHGTPVSTGDLLFVLTDNNLSIERQRTVGEIARLEEQLAAMNTQLLNPGRQNPTDPANNFDNNELLRRSLDEQLSSKRTELAIIDSQIGQLHVASPMSGRVLSWDVTEKLQDKPVQRGDLLVEVADVDGPWELELKLPDRRIGHLLRAQQEFGDDLPVTFLLASGPSQKWEGVVRSVAGTTDVDQLGGQTIRVQVDFEHEKLDIRQARSGVMAKIQCGHRSLGYVWLHDVWEFLQSKVFFRLW